MACGLQGIDQGRDEDSLNFYQYEETWNFEAGVYEIFGHKRFYFWCWLKVNICLPLDHFANATHINSTILIHTVAAHFCFRKHAANHTLNFPPLAKFLSAQLAMQESRAQAD